MHIAKKRIRKLENYLSFLSTGGVIIAVDLTTHLHRAKQIGFTAACTDGESVLPGLIGPVSRFNALGKERPRRDLPMETAYTQIEWCWNEWRGRGESERVCEVRDRSYRRYPREFISPPSVELKISQGMIMSPVFEYPTQTSQILHVINLFLEIFGECHIKNENLANLVNTPTTQVNWRILPEGVMPWERLKTHLEPVLHTLSSSKRYVFEERLKIINGYQPDFSACGAAGFHGYVIFGFKSKRLFIAESIWYGNAIYVFRENWRVISKMTKAEIIRGNLVAGRITHYADWQRKLAEILS